MSNDSSIRFHLCGEKVIMTKSREAERGKVDDIRESPRSRCHFAKELFSSENL